MRHALFPGSFDPLTLGHLDVIRRARSLFDQLTVGIGINPAKQHLLSEDERLALVSGVIADEGLDGVEVCSFGGLMVEAAQRLDATYVVRGLRGPVDLDYELAMALTNRTLAPGIETVFLAPSPQYAFITARFVREAATRGADVRGLVPERIAAALDQRRQEGR